MYSSGPALFPYRTSTGFSSPTSIRSKQGILFPELLQRVAEAAPEMRIRFMSPHPKVIIFIITLIIILIIIDNHH